MPPPPTITSPPVPATTFHDILHSPILDVLSHHLDIADIIALTRTSRSLSGFYACMLHRKWNVDRSLRRFVDRPAHFREQIGLAEALMAGDFPQEFFECGSLVAKTLDVVAMCAGAAALVSYLVAVEGYEHDDDREAALEQLLEPPYRHIDESVTLRRTRHADTITITTNKTDDAATINPPPQTPRIRIFTTTHFSFPLRGILEGSWTTATLCFMSYRRAYSIFPYLTYLSRTSFLLSRPRPEHAARVKRLRNRGYRVEACVSAHELAGRESGHGLQGWRKVGDRFCWVVGFPEVDGLMVDPVREEDVVRISECKADMDEHARGRLRACGLWEEVAAVPSEAGYDGVTRKGAKHLHHYDAKLMRWSKIFC